MEKSFSDLLRELREKRGFTVNQLALKSGVSAAHISRLENERRSVPKPKTINKLANVLGHYEELMAAAGYLPEQNDCDPNEAAAKTIEAALIDDPELLEFWQELVKREDLQLLFKQVKPLSPGSIKKIIKIIKAIEDEEAMED